MRHLIFSLFLYSLSGLRRRPGKEENKAGIGVDTKGILPLVKLSPRLVPAEAVTPTE
jgi:hypothetical protein